MRRIGYLRTSTETQCPALQQDALASCDLIFEDQVSGTRRSRPALDQALKAIQENETLVVWKLDRLGRDFRHLNDIADELHRKGAHLVSLTEGIDTSSAVGSVVFRLLTVFADFERGVIVERTKAGLEAARRRGALLGRPAKLNADQIAEAWRLIGAGASPSAIAHRYGVSRSTIYQYRRKASRASTPRVEASAQ